jgi:hypothetical protein
LALQAFYAGEHGTEIAWDAGSRRRRCARPASVEPADTVDALGV